MRSSRAWNDLTLSEVLHAFARSAACTEAEAFLSRLPEASDAKEEWS